MEGTQGDRSRHRQLTGAAPVPGPQSERGLRLFCVPGTHGQPPTPPRTGTAQVTRTGLERARVSIDSPSAERRGTPPRRTAGSDTRHEVDFVGLGRTFARTSERTARLTDHVVLRDISLSVQP